MSYYPVWSPDDCVVDEVANRVWLTNTAWAQELSELDANEQGPLRLQFYQLDPIELLSATYDFRGNHWEWPTDPESALTAEEVENEALEFWFLWTPPEEPPAE